MFSRENKTLVYGPSSGPRLVVTTPAESGAEAVARLERLAAILESSPPRIGVTLVVTENDYANLPDDVYRGGAEGTARVVSSLVEGEDPSVVILALPGPADRATIVPGARGITAPRWLLETAVSSLSRAGIPWTLAEQRLALYRVGWIPGNPLLAQYLQGGIPAIAIETDADLSAVVADVARALESGVPGNNDRHYLAFVAKGRPVFISERTLVATVMAASAGILLFLFIFSFLFGKRSEQHLRDLTRVWWLPFIYLAVTMASLYAGGAIASFLFRFRFGDPGSWTLLPHLALAGKFVLAWFVMATVMALNQLVRFPESGFIYGYISSIACVVNLFAFSSLDFSLTLVFLSAYAVSFVVSHMKHPALQAIGILCVVAPFTPYLAVLPSADPSVIAPLFSNAGLWNLRLALFVMPIQLMFSRFYHSLGAFGRRHRFYFPVSPVAALALSLTAIALILFMPAWTKGHPLPVELRQTLDERGFAERVIAPARLGNLALVEDPSLADFPARTANPADFVSVRSTSRKFIERRITDLTVDPAIPVARIEVTVTDPDGVAVYDASLPFEPLDAGRSCRFVSGANPDLPWKFRFSSAKDAKLSASVRLWTRANPRGLTVLNPDVRASYLLEIRATHDLSAGDGQ